eukprot:g78129.t1
MTIHKAQGLSFDRVFVDLGSGMFAHGQAYVALSRARTLQGLELSRPLTSRDICMDPRAFQYGPVETLRETAMFRLDKFVR